MDQAVAVVGLGCRYPGAPDVHTLWENVLARRQGFREMPDVRLPLSLYHSSDRKAPDKTYHRRAAVLEDFSFDWRRHRIPKSTVETTDIVHWLALEVALSAVEDAGLKEGLPKGRTGVVVGNSLTGEQWRSNAMRLRWPFVARSLTHAWRKKGLAEADLEGMLRETEHTFKSVFPDIDEDTLAGSLSNTIAGRICNYLDVHGGGYVVDGACASSLLSVITAARALVAGELDVALAGGVDISLDTFELIGFAKTGALSADQMQVYDRAGKGFLPGEGSGFVVLKRLSDAKADGDYVYATVCGWGVSSDGKGGITAPSVDGQALALRRAYEMAGYAPQQLDFVEGHGTGTRVGDDVELRGVTAAMQHFAGVGTAGTAGAGETAGTAEIAGPDGKEGVHGAQMRPTGMTSFKSLVGHTKAAAGVGGFIKAVLGVNQRVVPPTVGCHRPHAAFEAVAHGLYPVREGVVRSEGETLAAGVSAMGFGGINSHVTLKSGDVPRPQIRVPLSQEALLASWQETELFVASAATPEALAQKLRSAITKLRGCSVAELTDFCAEHSEAMSPVEEFRVASLASEPEGMLQLLDEAAQQVLTASDVPQRRHGGALCFGRVTREPRVGYLFPGQGSQCIGMGRRAFARHAWARQWLEHADASRQLSGKEALSDLLLRDADRAPNEQQLKLWQKQLAATDVAQPAIVIHSLIWSRTLSNLGLAPSVALGHSLGELSALAVAGGMDAASVIDLASARGEAMSRAADGSMAAVAASEEQVRELLPLVSEVVIANCNEPRQTVVSGPTRNVEAFVAALSERGVTAKHLPVSGAFHSPLMRPSAQTLRDSASVPAALGNLHTSVISGVTAAPFTANAFNEYVAEQVVSPVRFVEACRVFAEQCDVALEVGPGRVLSGLLRKNLAEIKRPESLGCFPLELKGGSTRTAHLALAALFVQGAALNLKHLYEGRLTRQFVPASQRNFIENPCEKPFSEAGDATLAAAGSAPASAALGTHLALPRAPGLSPEKLRAYLTDRGEFLTRFIELDAHAATRAESPHSAHSALDADAMSVEPSVPHRLTTSQLPEHEDARPPSGPTESLSGLTESQTSQAGRQTGQAGRQTESLESLLVNLVVEVTGFSKDTLHPELRLLDDLNLDSIKAAEFVAEAARRVGLSGDLDPAGFANSTLHEVAQSLRALQPSEASSQAGAESRAVDQPPPTSKEASDRSWTRSFALEWTPSASKSKGSIEGTLCLIGRSPADLPDSLRSRGIALTGNRSVADAFVWSVNLTEEHHALGFAIESLASEAGALPAEGTLYALVDRAKGTGVASFLASVHLERPRLKLRVLEFDRLPTGHQIVECLERVVTDTPYSRTRFDEQLDALVPVAKVRVPSTYASRGLTWDSDDVVVVTGGAKGITAECAVAFARATGAYLVLVGTSELESVAGALDRFSAAGCRAVYERCDLTDPEQVHALVASVQQKYGDIRGVIHGAGMNKPRPVEHVSAQAAREETAAKLVGGISLMKALEDDPPKLFVALTSVIGIAGMPGNAWYAFANETLDRHLESYGTRHPNCETQSLAYSIWEEVGMGARMGSVQTLRKMGIEAIPTDDGVEQFLASTLGDPQSQPVIITARMGGLATWPTQPLYRPRASRFLGEPLRYVAGVELAVRTHLTLEQDPYLIDHCFDGSYLFPTVFGVEAMAQVVAALTERKSLHPLRLEDVRLERPIVVDPERGLEVEVRAYAEEAQEEGRAVHVEIRTASTGFRKAHFSATFLLDLKATELVEGLPDSAATSSLPLEPHKHLYGRILFQGPRFQRIREVNQLDQQHCQLRVARVRSQDYILGDPFARDALLQSLQLCVTPDYCLPIGVQSWDILDVVEGGDWSVDTRTRRTGDREHEALVAASPRLPSEKASAPVEVLRGYRARVLERREDLPTPEQLASLQEEGAFGLEHSVLSHASRAGVKLPALRLRRFPGLDSMEREQRHRQELPFLIQTVHLALYDEAPEVTSPSRIRVLWQDSGKPVVEGFPNLGVSLSHVHGWCLCVAGAGRQGCDLQAIVGREEEDWRRSFAPELQPMLSALTERFQSVDAAGTLLWCATEASTKACDGSLPTLELLGAGDGSAHFKATTYQEAFGVYALSTSLEGVDYGVAVVTGAIGRERKGQPAHPAEAAASERPTPRLSHVREVLSKTTEGTQDAVQSGWDGGAFYRDEPDIGPAGQTGFVHRFPLTAQDSANRSRSVYFANYAKWAGKIRELAGINTPSFHSRFFAMLGSNELSGVTHTFETQIFGFPGWDDVMEGRLWVADVSDHGCELVWDWYRAPYQNPDQLVQVATSRMKVVVVDIVDHGEVRVGTWPDFARGYLDSMAQASRTSSSGSSTLIEHDTLPQLGTCFYAANSGPGQGPLAAQATFSTGRQHSNLVGNLYFANYVSWQGHLRDQFFHRIAPELDREDPSLGELLCFSFETQHLREAMPYDTIRAFMHIEEVYEKGVVLHFEYLRVEEDDSLTKLAVSKHLAAWVTLSPPLSGRGLLPHAVSHAESPVTNYRIGFLPEAVRERLLKYAHLEREAVSF